MTILMLSVKSHESPALRKLKARIVFRGDDIPGNAWEPIYPVRCCPGNQSTQSDVVRANTQAYLNTLVETWVELPSELTPPEYSKIKRPCVKLVKSLYGHPESGWHWDVRFKEVMAAMKGIHMSNFQSSYWFAASRLLMTLCR